jgi:hypothetical protein
MPLSDDQALYWYGLAAHRAICLQKPHCGNPAQKGTANPRRPVRDGGHPPRLLYSVTQQTAANAPRPAGSVPIASQYAEASPPAEEPVFDMEAELSALVGMEEVKQFFRRFAKQAEAAKKRQAAGHTVDSALYPNLVISGSPGRGKPLLPAGRADVSAFRLSENREDHRNV